MWVVIASVLSLFDDLFDRTTAPTESMSKPQPKKHQSANFTEAWLEFMDKRIAKTVAPMLNAQLIGGKKGDRWRDDIWTMRYLSGFKWEMLGEQVGEYDLERSLCSYNSLRQKLSPHATLHSLAYERQAHQARLRQSLSQSKTEQAEYLRNVELARVLDKRRAKKLEQGEDSAGPPQKRLKKATGEPVTTPSSGDVGSDKAKRKYRQRDLAVGSAAKTAGQNKPGVGNADRSKALQGVLDGLF
jgi:ESF2/ABP1 family protein